MSETPDFIVPDARSGPRDNAIPRFYVKPMKNNFKSEKEGRPIFDDVEFVEIIMPGDRTTTWDGMVGATHKQRWPQHYAYFKQGLEAPTEGTPISEWAAITRGQAEELAFAHVKTLEALAALSDEQLNKSLSMGGFALREKAQRALEQAAGSAPAEALAAENAVQKQKIDELSGTVKDLQAQVEKLLTGLSASASGAKG